MMLLTLAIRSQFVRLSRRKISRFQQLADELLWAESYLELLLLFQSHIERFFRIYHSDFWTQRLRRRYTPTFSFEALLLQTERPQKSMLDHWLVRAAARRLLHFLPDYGSQSSIAVVIARNVLLSKDFVAALARSRPYLGIDIIQNLSAREDGFFREEFFELYVTSLLAHQGGVLYGELANSRNQIGSHRYEITDRSRLLRFLFVDAKVAHKLEVYRPVGEFALNELDRLAREPEHDDYNQAYTEEKSREEQSALFATVHFFDIMVSESLFQGIAWHMWLYYFTYMVKRIVRNYKPADDPLVRPDAEFPIWYSYLLYNIFSALRNWILPVKEIPSDQENVRMASTGADHDNGNIPKSAILALADCTHSILLSDNLGEKLQGSLMDLVFGIYFDLRGSPPGDAYAEALTKAIRSGGFGMGSRAWTGAYRERVRSALHQQDRVRYYEYMVELDAALP